MAKTTAPLLSMGASGQIGKSIVASKWKGRPYMRRHVVPANPQPAPQSSTRDIFNTLGQIYKRAPALFTDPWSLFATGQVLTGNTGSAPTWGTASGGGLTWNEVTGTSQAAAINNGYICNNAGLVTVTLPSTAALGSVVRVTGKGAGGWLIAQNAGETIYFGTSTTTTGVGGSLASSAQRDSVELVCITADNDWNVISSIGNITVV